MLSIFLGNVFYCRRVHKAKLADLDYIYVYKVHTLKTKFWICLLLT